MNDAIDAQLSQNDRVWILSIHVQREQISLEMLIDPDPGRTERELNAAIDKKYHAEPTGETDTN